MSTKKSNDKKKETAEPSTAMFKVSPKEMIVTRCKSAQMKRQLRSKDRTAKVFTDFLLTGTSPKMQTRKDKNIKNITEYLSSRSSRRPSTSPTTTAPVKTKREAKGKKITLKQSQKCTKIERLTNKRKMTKPQKQLQETVIVPAKRAKLEMPVTKVESKAVKKPKTDVSKTKISLLEMRLNIGRDGKALRGKWPNELMAKVDIGVASQGLSIPEVIRMKEETEELTDEDLMEILLCPSPVWWEDPPDEDYDEDSIITRCQFNIDKQSNKEGREENKEDNTQSPSNLELASDMTNVEASSLLIPELPKSKCDPKFLKKRSVLENVLSDMKSKLNSKHSVDSIAKRAISSINENTPAADGKNNEVITTIQNESLDCSHENEVLATKTDIIRETKVKTENEHSPLTEVANEFAGPEDTHCADTSSDMPEDVENVVLDTITDNLKSVAKSKILPCDFLKTKTVYGSNEAVSSAASSVGECEEETNFQDLIPDHTKSIKSPFTVIKASTPNLEDSQTMLQEILHSEDSTSLKTINDKDNALRMSETEDIYLCPTSDEDDVLKDLENLEIPIGEPVVVQHKYTPSANSSLRERSSSNDCVIIEGEEPVIIIDSAETTDTEMPSPINKAEKPFLDFRQNSPRLDPPNDQTAKTNLHLTKSTFTENVIKAVVSFDLQKCDDNMTDVNQSHDIKQESLERMVKNGSALVLEADDEDREKQNPACLEDLKQHKSAINVADDQSKDTVKANVLSVDNDNKISKVTDLTKVLEHIIMTQNEQNNTMNLEGSVKKIEENRKALLIHDPNNKTNYVPILLCILTIKKDECVSTILTDTTNADSLKQSQCLQNNGFNTALMDSIKSCGTLSNICTNGVTAPVDKNDKSNPINHTTENHTSIGEVVFETAQTQTEIVKLSNALKNNSVTDPEKDVRQEENQVVTNEDASFKLGDIINLEDTETVKISTDSDQIGDSSLKLNNSKDLDLVLKESSNNTIKNKEFVKDRLAEDQYVIVDPATGKNKFVTVVRRANDCVRGYNAENDHSHIVEESVCSEVVISSSDCDEHNSEKTVDEGGNIGAVVETDTLNCLSSRSINKSLKKALRIARKSSQTNVVPNHPTQLNSMVDLIEKHEESNILEDKEPANVKSAQYDVSSENNNIDDDTTSDPAVEIKKLSIQHQKLFSQVLLHNCNYQTKKIGILKPRPYLQKKLMQKLHDTKLLCTANMCKEVVNLITNANEREAEKKKTKCQRKSVINRPSEEEANLDNNQNEKTAEGSSCNHNVLNGYRETCKGCDQKSDNLLIAERNNVKYCYQCSSIYDTEQCTYCATLVKNTRQSQDTKKLYNYAQCGLGFCGLDNLKMPKLEKDRPYLCDICNYRTTTKNLIKIHVRSHDLKRKDDDWKSSLRAARQFVLRDGSQSNDAWDHSYASDQVV